MYFTGWRDYLFEAFNSIIGIEIRDKKSCLDIKVHTCHRLANSVVLFLLVRSRIFLLFFSFCEGRVGEEVPEDGDFDFQCALCILFNYMNESMIYLHENRI